MEKLKGPRQRQVTLRLPREVFYQLTAFCGKHDISLSEFLRCVVCSLSLQQVEIALSRLHEEVS